MIILRDTHIEDIRDIGQAYRPAGVSMSEQLRNELQGINENLEKPGQALFSQATCELQTKH